MKPGKFQKIHLFPKKFEKPGKRKRDHPDLFRFGRVVHQRIFKHPVGEPADIIGFLQAAGDIGILHLGIPV